MSLTYNAFGGNMLGRANAAADTVFYAVVPAHALGYTRVAGFNYTAGNTANAFTGMRSLGTTTVATAVAANTAVLVLSGDPSPTGNPIAAGDQVVIEHSDGTYRRAQVNTAGWAANTNTVTFTANVAAAVSAGASVWNFGVPADTDPEVGTAHPVFPTVANTTGTFTFGPAGLSTHNKDEPLLLYNPNATNATVLNYLEFAHTTE